MKDSQLELSTWERFCLSCVQNTVLCHTLGGHARQVRRPPTGYTCRSGCSPQQEMGTINPTGIQTNPLVSAGTHINPNSSVAPDIFSPMCSLALGSRFSGRNNRTGLSPFCIPITQKPKKPQSSYYISPINGTSICRKAYIKKTLPCKYKYYNLHKSLMEIQLKLKTCLKG